MRTPSAIALLAGFSVNAGIQQVALGRSVASIDLRNSGKHRAAKIN